VTSGRISQAAIASISGKLQKSNLSKLLTFIDLDDLIELIDRSYPSYWSEGSDDPHGQRLERFDVSPDKRYVISRAFVLEDIWLCRNTSFVSARLHRALTFFRCWRPNEIANL
jgi:hypothetical protein